MDETRRNMILGGLALGLMPDAGWSGTGATGARIAGGPAFGSTWRLVSGGRDPALVSPWISHQIAAVDAAMSPYRQTSPLSRFNRAEVGQEIAVPAPMAHVARAALEIHQTTQGAFDPTIGPQVQRFGFGPITGQAGGAEAIVLGQESVRKEVPGITLDLCGIAKGFALDLLTNGLVAQGAENMLLELGGEVRAIGRHPSGRPWQVAIEDPLAPGFAAHRIVAPGARALATSGHRANGVSGEIALSHVIDPGSTRPAVGFAASVSVLASTGMEADAMATALLAMGAGGPAFARANGVSALFILDAAAAGQTVMTGDFADHVVA